MNATIYTLSPRVTYDDCLARGGGAEGRVGGVRVLGDEVEVADDEEAAHDERDGQQEGVHERHYSNSIIASCRL